MIKKFKWVIIIVLPVLILVIIRSFGANHFRSDAERWAEPSVLKTNVISIEQAESLAGEKLIINLDIKQYPVSNTGIRIACIPPDSLLTKKYLKLMKANRGPLLLNSSDKAAVARIWMLLSQMGIGNIFILTDETNDELFKHKFRPDTIIRPEF